MLEEIFPMSPKEIKSHQEKDPEIEKIITAGKDIVKSIKGQKMILYHDHIYIPATLKKRQ